MGTKKLFSRLNMNLWTLEATLELFVTI